MSPEDVMPALIDAGFGIILQEINPSIRPPSLFHFTTIEGLLGMVTNQSLWASLATSLNDASEIVYTVQIADELMEARRIPDHDAFCDHVRYYLDPDNSPPEFRFVWHSFVTSFCGRVDSATHWLHYGRSGTGVAVAFDSKAIVQQPFDLIKVVYDPNQQREFIVALILAVLNRFEGLVPGASMDPAHPLFRAVAHLAAQAVWAAAPRFKSAAFATEEEWRLVTYEIEGVSYPPMSRHVDLPTRQRANGTRLVAYKEITFQKLPVSEVILGWACDTRPDDYAAAQLLPGVPISRSSVPLRP